MIIHDKMTNLLKQIGQIPKNQLEPAPDIINNVIKRLEKRSSDKFVLFRVIIDIFNIRIPVYKVALPILIVSIGFVGYFNMFGKIDEKQLNIEYLMAISKNDIVIDEHLLKVGMSIKDDSMKIICDNLFYKR